MVVLRIQEPITIGEGRVMTVPDIAARAFLRMRKLNGNRRQPGSAGERILQERYGTTQRAQQFYRNQVTGQLTPAMQQFIRRMDMAFIATSDGSGHCDCSFAQVLLASLRSWTTTPSPTLSTGATA